MGFEADQQFISATCGPWVQMIRQRCPAGTFHVFASRGGISSVWVSVALLSATAVRSDEYSSVPPLRGGRFSTA